MSGFFATLVTKAIGKDNVYKVAVGFMIIGVVLFLLMFILQASIWGMLVGSIASFIIGGYFMYMYRQAVVLDVAGNAVGQVKNGESVLDASGEASTSLRRDGIGRSYVADTLWNMFR